MKKINELELAKLVKTAFDGSIIIETNAYISFSANEYNRQTNERFYKSDGAYLIKLNLDKICITTESDGFEKLLRIDLYPKKNISPLSSERGETHFRTYFL